MKHPTKIFWLGLAAILAIVVLLTGCGTTSNLLVQPGTVEIVRPAQTNYVTLMLTNTVDGQEVITAAVQPVILPAITFTNQELTTLASSTINAAGTAGAVAGVPFSGLIANALLAGIGIALAWLNARAKRKLLAAQTGHAETAEALAVAEDVGKTLVQNLELLRKTALQIPGYTPDIDNRVMTIIQQVQEAAKVKTAINQLVDEHTGYTKTEAETK
jgi:hypothetical protein